MDPRQCAEKFVEAEESRDPERIVACFTDDAILEAHGTIWRGKEQIGRRYTALVIDYPRIRVTIIDSFVDGDRAAICWDAVGADWRGLEYTARGVSLTEQSGDRIARMRIFHEYDTELLRLLT